MTLSQASLWVYAFELLERMWQLCSGVCEYAIGKGNVGYGPIALGPDELGQEGSGEGEGEEDARMLGDVDDALIGSSTLRSATQATGVGAKAGNEKLTGDEGEDEDEEDLVRRGRLMLRQLQHNTYHLHARLKSVLGDGERQTGISEPQLKMLVGSRWFGGKISETIEGSWWSDLARVWGMTRDAGDAGDAG